MSISIIRASAPRHVAAGQDGYNEQTGLAQFNATDTTGTIDCPFGHITDFSASPIGGADAVYLDMASSVADGVVARSATGQITITRPATGATSGLYFFYRIRGRA